VIKKKDWKVFSEKKQVICAVSKNNHTKDFPEDQRYPCTMYVLNWVELIFYEKLENQSVQLRI
jgi:hypothetical protein